MIKLLKWLLCLSKRLYKKWLFVILICLIPLSAAALKATSTKSKGFVQIAVVNNAGDIGDKIYHNLTENGGIINFIRYKSDVTAKRDLEAGRLDAVWTLPENTEKRIADFVKNPKGDNYIVYIMRREDNLKTRLALEKLSGALFPFTSRQFFLKCVREDPDFDVSNLSDSQIYKYYDDFFNDDKLFKFAFPDNKTQVKESEQNYITSPVRGLLSVVTLLSGLAAAMLFISDDKKGVFSFAKNSNRVLISFIFQLTAVVNIGFFMFVSTFLLGVNAPLWREISVTAVFAINTAMFCTVLQQLVNRIVYFAPLLALISVLDILICPIFFDFTVQKTPQYLFPNTYYINSVHSDVYLKYSLLYTLALAVILSLFYLRKRKA